MSSSGNKIEIAIVLECSQTRVDSEKIRRILADLERTVDWPFVFKVADRNGLLPLVTTNLLRNFSDLLDEELRAELSEFLSDHIRNNLLQIRKVIELSQMLDAAGVPMLAFKGPTLSMQAYGDISLRQFVDLDMLVRPRDFDKAVDLLQDAGYVPIEKVSWLKRKRLFFTRKKDLGLISADRQVRLELHWKLSGTHFAMPFEIDQLWQRLECIEIAGSELRSLPFNDQFVYLCLHGSRHGWEKLLWICDINELIHATKESGARIDWFKLREHARTHGCEKAVELGLFLIESFFGRRTNYPGIDRVLSDKVFADIAANVRKNAFTSGDRSMERSEWYTYHLSLKEKTSDRLRIHLVYLIWYLKVALKPNEMDEAVFRLPALFYPLYYLIRPIRLTLTKRHGKLS